MAKRHLSLDLSEGERPYQSFLVQVVTVAEKRVVYIRLPSDVRTCDCSTYKPPLVIVRDKTGLEWLPGNGTVDDSQLMIEALVLGNRIVRQLNKELPCRSENGK